MAHKEFGERLLERVKKDLDAVGLVEQFPRLEGRQMVMVLAPKKKGPPPAKAKAAKPKPDKPKAPSKVAVKPAEA
jgi:translation initiation factor IF-3